MQAKQTWHQRLNSIGLIRQAGLIDWQPIKSGTSNSVFKVTTESAIWVVRINRATLGIDRLQEKKIMDLIAPLGIGPKVIENDPAAGHLITEFIHQPNWQASDLKDPLMLTTLKQGLNQFHAIEYQYIPSRLDIRLKLYLKSIDGTPESTCFEILDTIQRLDRMGFWQANNTLFHSDLNPNNLLGHKQLTIIDWEFAGQGHPLLDWLILEHESQVDLSANYPTDINPAWVEPAKRLIRAMMNLWPQASP